MVMMTPLSNGLRALGLALALVMMGPVALARDYIVAVVESEPITNLEVQLTARWRALLANLPAPNPTPAELRRTLDQVIVDRVLYELSRVSDRDPVRMNSTKPLAVWRGNWASHRRHCKAARRRVASAPRPHANSLGAINRFAVWPSEWCPVAS